MTIHIALAHRKGSVTPKLAFTLFNEMSPLIMHLDVIEMSKIPDERLGHAFVLYLPEYERTSIWPFQLSSFETEIIPFLLHIILGSFIIFIVLNYMTLKE